MSSRFKALFDEAKQVEMPEEKKKRKPVQKKVQTTVIESKPAKIKGKRSNPDYIGAFAYIPGKLHEEVKIKLLRKKDLDFSELIEQLLAKWLADQK